MKRLEILPPYEPLAAVVIGAGPIGLAAAAHLAERSLDFVVLEAGAVAGASVLEWGHVRMFSPWRYNIDAVSARLLSREGWTPPDDDAFPTGRQLHDLFLAPLAVARPIAPRLRLQSRVVAVARDGGDRQASRGRAEAPFVVRVRPAQSDEYEIRARAVIDASGTWGRPKPLGASGLPALGEAAATGRIRYGMPDVLGTERPRYAGRSVAVVGAGDSAFNVLGDLVRLAEETPGTDIHWVIRGQAPGFGGGVADQLPARARLGGAVRELVERRRLTLHTGFAVRAVATRVEGVELSDGGERLGPFDEIVCVTGFRPDHDMLRELRLALDPVTEAPAALGPLIDPNLHSCGTVPPHGHRELAHPEPGFYVVGMKSYGRAPTFLLMTGYEQVRSVVAALAGDLAAADDVALELPETGVCSATTLPVLSAADACLCGGPPGGPPRP